jgi:heme exporter protein D
MSPIPSPQPAPIQPAPAEPFVKNPSESAIFWLVVGIAGLFVAYLIVDAIIQRVRKRRVEREWKERARRAASRAAAEAQGTAGPLNERPAKELPPPR